VNDIDNAEKSPTAGPFDRRQRLIMVAVVVTTGLFTIDLTIVTVALPEIGRDFTGSVIGLQWVVVAYTVTFGSLLQIAGSLSDRIGVKPMFLMGIAGFTLSSLACGLAPNLVALDVSRGVQGATAAVMFANVMPLLARTFGEAQRARAIGVWSGVIGVAGVLAPVLGGLLVETTGWRSMFLINLPFGIAAFVLVAVIVRDDIQRSPIQWRSFDFGGAVLLVAGLLALNFGLAEAQSSGWGAATTITMLTVGLLGVFAFALREKFATAPILDIDLLRNSRFAGVAVLALVNRIGTVGSLVYLILLLQDGYSYSPSAVGLLLAPMGVATLLASIWAGSAQARVDPRLLLGTGFALLAASSAVLAWQISAAQDPRVLIPATLVWGLGNALSNTPIMAVATTSIPIERVGMGTGLVNSFFPIGAGLGTAALGTVFAVSAGTEQNSFDRSTLAAGTAANYIVVTVLMVVGVIVAATMSRAQPTTSAD